ITPVPCTVSTDKAETVAIHVGPGKSRGLRDYMVPNQAYQVIGQAQASDGSAWWKLKTADGSDAWVAQADVKAAGGCAQTGIVATPPVQTAKPRATNTPISKPTTPGQSGGGGGNPPPPQPTAPPGQPTYTPLPPTQPPPTSPPCNLNGQQC